MVAAALLVAFNISASFAQTLTLTGTLNSSNVSCATLAGYTTLNIGDGTIATTWTIDNDLDLSTCPSPITIAINGNANLYIEPSYTLSLPTGSKIILNGSGYITDDISCAASSIIQIGAIKTATCNGHGGGSPLNSFTEINAFGRTGSVNSNSNVCTGDPINLTATPSSSAYSYSWTGPSGFNSNLPNPTATATITGLYIVTITNISSNRSIQAGINITVNPKPKISFDQTTDQSSENITICGLIGGSTQNDIDIRPGSPVGTYQWEYSTVSSAGPWIIDPYTGTQLVASSFASTPGKYYFRLSVNGSCPSNIIDLTVTGTAPTSPAGSGASRCGSGSLSLTATGYSGCNGLRWYSSQFAGTQLGSSSPFSTPSINTTTTYYVSCTSGGCESPRTAVTAAINPSQPASVSIAAIPSGTICVGTSVTFTATPTNGGATPTYQWKKGGVIIPGETSDTYISTALSDNDKIAAEMTSNAVCATGSPVTSNEITVSVTPTVGIPVFTLGASSARDQGAVSVTYTATASNSTGITYSLDAASLAGGNTINSSTGEVTYIALWSWKSIITASASGCNGTKTADHVVGVNWCYALFTANGALSCAGASVIKGNVGTFVGATTGFTAPAGPGILLPPGHIDAEASAASAQAAAQAVAVYNDLAAIPSTEDHLLPEITLVGSKTLTPHVFYYEGALTISGDITLDGLGNPNAVFIFKINGALTTNTGSNIILTGGASFRNVYWRVYGAVVLSGLEFKGTIVNEGAFTVNTGAALEGRALSINGAIAITDNVITSDCYPLFTAIDNTKPIFVPPADISECVESLSNVAYNPLTTVINPDRPDYYTFSDLDTRLNLNTTLFTDDEPLTCPPDIRWQIDFSPASDLNPPYNLVTQPSITGSGQPSEHIGNILFPGDGITFNPVVHHITWWIKDCAGNESPSQKRTITIKPRPSIL